MIIVDTNVVSAFRRLERAEPRFALWARSIPATDLYLSVVSIQELETGILSIERRDPRQGEMLRDWFEGRILPGFGGRVLPVDIEVARRCAHLHDPDRRCERDALIAATALVHRMPVATRNVADFAATGVDLINPWEYVAP